MEKQIKDRFLEEISDKLGYLKEIELSVVIAHLTDLKEKYTQQGYYNLRLDVVKYDYDGDIEINLWGESLETDEEFDKRVGHEVNLKAQQEESKRNRELEERHEYERLKRKFEHNKNTQEKL